MNDVAGFMDDYLGPLGWCELPPFFLTNADVPAGAAQEFGICHMRKLFYIFYKNAATAQGDGPALAASVSNERSNGTWMHSNLSAILLAGPKTPAAPGF